MKNESDEQLRQRLKNIVLNMPEQPGSYQYLDDNGVIIYVGKAKNLKRRVASYFHKEVDRFKTKVLVSKIRDIKYTVVNTESHQEIQAPLQCLVERRQDLSQHLCHQRAIPSYLQDP